MVIVVDSYEHIFCASVHLLLNRIDRLTAILIQLQTKKVVKAQEIADRFEISLRTVYRDVQALLPFNEISLQRLIAFPLSLLHDDGGKGTGC